MQVLARNIRVNKSLQVTHTFNTHIQSTEKQIAVAVQLLSPSLCDSMDFSTSGFPVLHYLLDFAQTHVYWVDDTIQPGHSLSPPSPPALNLPQHQGLFQWVSSSHQVTKVLELQLKHQSSNEYSRLISLRLDCLISLLSTGLLRVFSSTTIQKHQFFSTQPSLWSSSHIHTWLLENPALMI